MTERQYRQLWLNRQRVRARGLGMPHPRSRDGESVLNRIIRRAADQLRRREAATQAWVRVVPVGLAAETWIIGLEGPTLRVGVRTAAAAFELRRQRTKLATEMARNVAGVSDVRFDVGRPPAPEVS